MTRRILEKILAPIRRRISLIVTRAVVTLVDDKRLMQEVQVRLLANEDMDDVERLQQYGFSSVPHPGAEGIALSVGGKRSNTVIINVDDRRYRLKSLAGGEVAIYSDEDQEEHGHRIVLRRGGIVEVQGDTLNFRGETLVHISGKEVEIHADTRLETDVAGHGEAKNFNGSTWKLDTYTTGAVFDASEEHGVQSPEVE